MAITTSVVTAAASPSRYFLRKHTGPRPNYVDREDETDDELDGAVAESEKVTESEKANAGQTSTRNASSLLPLENNMLKIDDGTALRVNAPSYFATGEMLYYTCQKYAVVPVSNVRNVPTNVKKVLNERWKFLVLEVSQVKELTSAMKSCKHCEAYCASDNSVECVMCRFTYHMSCIQPRILKKPSRGFAWACGLCSQVPGRKLQTRNTPRISERLESEEEEDHGVGRDKAGN
ncbi:MAG: putative PHD type zinc finger protein with BAH domain-containing protein [Peltula sp. TS41687]|nr:MAG: putative PHD type zinc finger protein with BAH domain-containing protein [Peltula sp. TS41687]